MAKETKKVPPKREFNHRYGVNSIAKEMGLTAASVRIALRDSDFEKAEDGTWGWDSDKDFKEVIAYFNERRSRRPDTRPTKEVTAKKKGSDPRTVAKHAAKAKEASAPAGKPTRKKAA